MRPPFERMDCVVRATLHCRGVRGWQRRVRNGERVRCICSTRAIVRQDYLSIVYYSLALSLLTTRSPPIGILSTSRQALYRVFRGEYFKGFFAFEKIPVCPRDSCFIFFFSSYAFNEFGILPMSMNRWFFFGRVIA